MKIQKEIVIVLKGEESDILYKILRPIYEAIEAQPGSEKICIDDLMRLFKVDNLYVNSEKEKVKELLKGIITGL